MKYLLYTLIYFLFLISMNACYRSMKTTPTDEVYASLFFSTAKEDYVLNHEFVFQVTSFESSGGSTTRYGYNKMRFSVYALKDGSLVARKTDFDDDETYILGMTPGFVWVYSSNEDMHFYALDPLTLEIKLTNEDLFRNDPEMRHNLKILQGKYISDYHYLDENSKKLIVTTNDGYRHIISLDDFSIEDWNKNMPRDKFYVDKSWENTINYHGNKFELKYGERDYMRDFENDVADSGFSVIDGKFIIEKNSGLIEKFIIEEKEQVVNKIDSMKIIEAQIDSMRIELFFHKIGPEQQITMDTAQKRKYAEQYHALHKKFYYANKYIQDILNSEFDENIPLYSKDKSLYVMHRNSLDEKSYIKIMKLKILNNKVQVIWDTPVATLMANESYADEIDEIDGVSYSPSYDDSYIRIVNNKLIIIWQLRMICMDADNGWVLWQKRL